MKAQIPTVTVYELQVDPNAISKLIAIEHEELSDAKNLDVFEDVLLRVMSKDLQPQVTMRGPLRVCMFSVFSF